MIIWEITDSPASQDAADINEGVFTYGRALASDGNARPLACFVREADVLIGGGVGRTEYNRLFINSLWIAEHVRSQGLGTQVLVRMEEEARERGCHDALMETLDNRVALLYERLGYKTVAKVEGYVGPFTRHIMVKQFTYY